MGVTTPLFKFQNYKRKKLSWSKAKTEEIERKKGETVM